MPLSSRVIVLAGHACGASPLNRGLSLMGAPAFSSAMPGTGTCVFNCGKAHFKRYRDQKTTRLRCSRMQLDLFLPRIRRLTSFETGRHPSSHSLRAVMEEWTQSVRSWSETETCYLYRTGQRQSTKSFNFEVNGRSMRTSITGEAFECTSRQIDSSILGGINNMAVMQSH